MFKATLLLLSFGFCYVYCFTSCQTNMKTCMQDAFEKVKASLPPKPDFAAIKAQNDQCFTNASCTVPTFNNAKPEGDNGNAIKECFKNAGEIIQTCIAAKVPNFELPAPPKGSEHHFGGHGKFGENHNGNNWPSHSENFGSHSSGGWSGHGGNKGHGGFFDNILNESCGNDSSKVEAVKNCFQGLHKNQPSEHHKASGGNHKPHSNPMHIFCEIKQNCSNQYPDCKTEEEQIKTVAKECMTTNEAALKDAKAKCLPTPPATDSGSSNGSNGQENASGPSGHGGYHHPMFDMCDNQGNNGFQRAGGSGGQGFGHGRQGSGHGGQGSGHGGHGSGHGGVPQKGAGRSRSQSH